jgi:diguanylate cyclase (GGDEF)-like protein
MTAALAVVLLGLSLFTLWGTLQTTRATQAQSHALALDAAFSDAANAVAIQQMYTHQYQLDPSVAGWVRYVDSAAAADDALRKAERISSGSAPAESSPMRDARADASRLRGEHAVYRQASDRFIVMVAGGSPNAAQQDLVQVTPAYYTLKRDIDGVSRAYHGQAQQLVADLHSFQVRILATTALGFALGLGLVAMIWRLMLAYQRRIIEHAEASQHQALHDPLTGLANRLLFERRLDAALVKSNSNGDRLAVMLIDLNGFKRVNDTLGHHAGDQVLIETSHRLRKVCREGETVARIGGDEFAVLMPGSATVDVVREVADRVREALRYDYVLPAGSAAVSGSVGVVLGAPGMGADDMLRHADAAMYRAKTTTKEVAVYDAQTDIDQTQRMALLGDLRVLLDEGDPNGELALSCQPRMRHDNATVMVAESLVVWRHPRLGLLLPEVVLAVAKNGGLEVPLTYHVLQLAVTEAARWRTEAQPRVVSVNVSPTCPLDEALVGKVRSTLAEHGLPAPLLRLEITESAVAADPARTVAVLDKIRGDGVQISVNGYGMGSGSLNQRRQAGKPRQRDPGGGSQDETRA